MSENEKLNLALRTLALIAEQGADESSFLMSRVDCQRVALKAIAQINGQAPQVAAVAKPTPEKEVVPTAQAKKLPKGVYTAYADGACHGNPGPAGWGVVIQSSTNASNHEASASIAHATNQIAELCGAIGALSQIEPGSTVTLVSDSQYVLKGIKEWRQGWEKKGWRNAAGQPVANANYWKELFALVDSMAQVECRWVKGHDGNEFNERCDALATAAVNQNK